MDDDDTVIGVVVGIDGSNCEDVVPSVALIDGSDEVLTGLTFELPDTGSTRVSVTWSVDDVDEVRVFSLATDEPVVLDGENLVDVGSADDFVILVLPAKLGDGDSVTYDVEKELLTVRVAVVGVTVGMDDKTDEVEVLSFPSPLPPSPPSPLPSPPSTTFLEVDDDTGDELSKDDDKDELSILDLNDDVVYPRLVVDSENFVSVTAMVVPVDLPGEKVIVSGIVGRLVVERTNSEVLEELVPLDELSENCEDVELLSRWLSDEIRTDEEVTVIGVVVGTDGNSEEPEVGTCTSDELAEDCNDDDEIDWLRLKEDLVMDEDT